MDNIERVNNVYFELYSAEQGRKVINEPDGWNEDFLTLERDKDSKDIRKKIEIDLSFTGVGSEYLSNLYYSFGVFPNCLISKYEKSNDSIDEVYNLVYVQRIDLNTFDRDSDTGVVKVKAHEGGLFDFIKNRYDDEVDLLSNFSMDGEFIGELKVHPFQPIERKIFLKSLLEGEKQRYRIGSGYWASEALYHARPVPFEITYKSDGAGDIQVPTLVDDNYGDNNGRSRSAPWEYPNDTGFTVGSDLPFFFSAEEPKTLEIDALVSFKITEFEERFAEGTPRLYVKLVKSEKGQDGEQKMKEYEDFIDIAIESNIGTQFEVPINRTVQLEEGESLSLLYVFYVSIDSSINPFKNGYANVFVDSTASISIKDITEYPPQIGRAIKPIDLFDRLVAKITGKTGLVRSEAFGEGGDMEFMVVDNGFFARGFPNSYTDEADEEIAIQFNTSFKNAYEAFDAITPMCWITQKEGNTEIVRVEPDTYTQQNFIGVVIDNADEIKEKCSDKDQFSKIELGHEGDLEYEEVNGLDEYNGKATFATHLGRSTDRKYSKVSKYRFDPQGYELTRRVSFDRFPYEDTERDEDIWIHDAKPIEAVVSYNGNIFSGLNPVTGTLITHRTWQDDFSAAPKGINFPDTAWNLRLSPMNLLLNGHGSAVRRCLYHDTNKFIRFSASNANQNLITFTDGNSYAESGQVQIVKLPKQRIRADEINMTIKVTPKIREQLDGFNERGVRNVFGLVQYQDKGVSKYGRIVKLTSGENSKLQLIKAGI